MLVRRIVLAALLGAGAAFAADEPWPERVVTFEQMTLTKPLRINVMTTRSTDRSRTHRGAARACR